MYCVIYLGMICERPKGKRILILTAREQYIPTLNRMDLKSFGGFGESTLWSKMSSKGIFLVTSPRTATEPLLGMKSYQLFGKCLLDFVHDDDYENLRSALSGVLEGKICHIVHRIRHSKGFKYVESVFFPGGYHYPVRQNSQFVDPRRNLPIVAYIFQRMTVLDAEPSSLDAKYYGIRPIVHPDEEDVFSAFNPNKETSWQYELHMLKSEHKQIMEILGQIE